MNDDVVLPVLVVLYVDAELGRSVAIIDEVDLKDVTFGYVQRQLADIGAVEPIVVPVCLVNRSIRASLAGKHE